MASKADEGSTKAVGPYLLQRTLGKGQTGLVRLGVHCVTGRPVAIKIINREKLSKAVLLKVEREIAIMKLIHHPHVLGLFDVYENSKLLYLVLEHVSGGELFDYLVRKGRLSEKEARRFFRQIVSAVDFCHKHKVCHRDLKPENLLLDESKNIKVADFGMASLQVGQKMLETSCGSPHYACPEVIRGEQYDGRKADVWSCGVILFALLVGALPFDDDDLRMLLEKVKRGHFQVPPYVPTGVQQLLRGMVEVNPKKRLTLDEVMRHPWFKGTQDLELHLPIQDIVQTCPIEDESCIDPDVFDSMSSLGCFKDKSVLTKALLSPEPNEEKIVYFLLLSHKERQPSLEDETKVPGATEKDPPRKRIDSRSASTPLLQNQRTRAQSTGSAGLDQLPPRSPRLSVTARPPNYSTSSGDYYTYSSSSPGSKGRKSSIVGAEGVGQAATLQLGVSPLTPPTAGAPWRRKLSQTMKHLTVSPRFHRKRYEGSETEASSPVMPKRSWFSNFRSEKEKGEVVVVLRQKSFPELKSSILKSFNVVNCQYEETSENSFKIKYEKSARQKGKTVFKKAVKFVLAVSPTQTISDNSIPFDGKTFTATFTQTAGPTRRFRRVCEKLQATIVSPSAINRMCLETTQSISSDEALAPGPPVLLLNSTDDTDERPIESHNGGPPPLLTSYDSTDIESDDDGT